MSQESARNIHQNLEENPKYTQDIDLLKKSIIEYKDFPKPGISFKDTFSLIKNVETFQKIIDICCDIITESKADVVVGLEARGFILGGAIAYKLKIPFVPVRKKNKLPGPLKTVSYTLEYGEDTLQIQESAVKPEQRVAIIDDVIATGGSVKATIDLINSIGGSVSNIITIIGIQNSKWESVVDKPVTTFFRV